MNRNWKPLAAVVLSCTFVVPLGAEIFEQVLVKVNGDIITKTEFEQRQVAELRNRPELGNVSPASPELRKAVAEITPDLILAAVDELLLVQRGREMGWAMGDEQFNSILANLKKQNNLEDEDKFLAALKQEGMTLPELRRNFEKSMLVTQVQRVEVNDKIGVTEEEAKAYYAEHAKEFTTPSEVTLREILIEVPTTEKGVNVAQDDEIKAKTEALRSAAAGGRAVSADGRRLLGGALAGQRGPHRPVAAGRAGARFPEGAGAHEGRRRHRAYQDDARLPVAEARVPHRDTRARLRRCAKRHRPARGGNEASGRAAEIPRPPALTSHRSPGGTTS